MKKYQKFLIAPIIFSFLVLPAFSSAQTQTSGLNVGTIGCSVKGPTTVIFEGAYSNNIQKKRVTTYFEYKKGSPDFSVSSEKTIKYVPQTGSPKYNYFYQSPGTIKPMSIYYFRAVSYFTDDPNASAFYGNTLTCNTHYSFIQGSYQPQGQNSGNIPYQTAPVVPPIVSNSNLNAQNTPTAITKSATKITSNSVILNGMVNIKNNSGANAVFYYMTDADYNNPQETIYTGWAKADENPIVENTNTNVSASIAQVLEPNTVYHYVVFVEGSDGTELQRGADMTFKTLPLPIDISEIDGVAPPVAEAVPVATITETNEYTGTVAWSPTNNPFVGGTKYTAVITLTPKDGYTLMGVPKNFFFVPLVSTVTNNANSGTVIAVFPATTVVNPLNNPIVNPTVNPTDNPTTLSTDNTQLIPCGTSTNTAPCEGKEGWNNLMKLVNNVVNFVLFKLALPIGAIMFVYAGFELLTSGGNTEKMKKAKKIFINVVIGLALAAAAWLIINTILTILGYDGSWIGFT